LKKRRDIQFILEKKNSLISKEEVLFDCNDLAKDYEFFNLSNIKISPNNKLAVFSVDTVSRRLYTIKIKDLESGDVLIDSIENCTGSFVWANDNQTFFYTKRNTQTLRNDKIYKHTIGSSYKEDV